MKEGRWSIIFQGFKVSGGSDTYKPSEDSLLIVSGIAEYIVGSSTVYDVGTGSGVIALWIASKGIYVVGIDIRWESLLDAFNNALDNSLHGYIDFILCDTLEALRMGIYGLKIVSNPPYLPGSISNDYDYQYVAGSEGTEVIEEILRYVAKYNNEFYFIASSYTNLKKLASISKNMNLYMEKLDELVLNGEKLFLFRVRGKK